MANCSVDSGNEYERTRVAAYIVHAETARATGKEFVSEYLVKPAGSLCSVDRRGDRNSLQCSPKGSGGK